MSNQAVFQGVTLKKFKICRLPHFKAVDVRSIVVPVPPRMFAAIAFSISA